MAFGGERQQGIAQAVYELTGRPAAIEDRFGNLLAWAGPGQPDHYRRADPDQRDRLLDRATTAAGPVREGDRLTDADGASPTWWPRGSATARWPTGSSLSPHTVAFHLRDIFWKLGVTSRVQLARMAAAGQFDWQRKHTVIRKQ